MIIRHSIIILFLCSILFISCTPNEPQTLLQDFSISKVDVSVLEAYIEVHASSLKQGETVVIYRNSQPRLSFTSSAKDTIISDSSLSENTLYSYSAKAFLKDKETARSNQISLNTLTSTSQQVEWQSYYFGDFEYSQLLDVTITDNAEVWAAGKIYQLDSEGKKDYEQIGAVHYDGNKCELFKVPYMFSATQYPPYPRPGVISTILSVEDELFASGPATLLKKAKAGNQWNQLLFLSGKIDEVFNTWGVNKNSIYCAGSSGKAVHFDGIKCESIDLGTKTAISDLWGVYDVTTGKERVFFAVSNLWVSEEPGTMDRKLLEYSDGRVKENEGLPPGSLLSTVWTNRGFPVFTGLNPTFTNASGKWKEIKELSAENVIKIRGIGLNNIVAVGNDGLIAHYNGKSWKIFNELKDIWTDYYAVAIKGNIIAAAGLKGSRAVLTIGRRN